MKICVINHRYFVSGGPERYMFGVTELLQGAGHQVVPFSVRYTQNLPSPWERYFVSPIAGEDEVYFKQHSWTPRTVVKSLERAFYSKETYDSLTRLLRDERPDVALVLHYLRKLSPSVLTALRDNSVPIVVRLSDFGMVCPEQHLMRGGRMCRDCVGTSLWPSVRHRCVQGSLGSSAVNALAMAHAHSRRRFDAIDRFIAPSSIMRDEMVAGGYDPARIAHIPTFVVRQAPTTRPTYPRSLCYVGRIEPIKGVDVLIDGFTRLVRTPGFTDVGLVVVGDHSGDEALRLKSIVERDHLGAAVTFVGKLDRAGALAALSAASVSVIPSVCSENLPNVLLESLACGTPVVGSNVPSIAEALQSTGAGALFATGDAGSLRQVLAHVLSDERQLATMSAAARRLARDRFSPEQHLTALLRLFETVLSGESAGAPSASLS